MSVVALLGDSFKDKQGERNFALTLMLGIAFAANIGGITTLIGTPPNLVLASIVDESGLAPLNFSDWLFFAFPLVIILFSSVYMINTKLAFPVTIKKLEGIQRIDLHGTTGNREDESKRKESAYYYDCNSFTLEYSVLS